MTLTPTIFYICSYCAHMHALSPSFFLCKWKEGELIHILGCYPWEPKSIPLHSMLRWTPGLRGRDRHVYGCQWLTVRPHWIICLHSKRPPQLALLEALDWVEKFHYFSSSSKPPRACISNGTKLGMVRIVGSTDQVEGKERLVGKRGKASGLWDQSEWSDGPRQDDS